MLLRVFILLIAVTAAGGAAWLTSTMGPAEQPMTNAQSVEAAKQVPTKDVLVSLTEIPSGGVLSPDKLLWRPMPEAAISEEYILRDSRPDAIGELSGSFVNAPFAKGEPITDARLMETNINLLSTKIESGMRAAAVKISAENTAGGFILPGDRVDVVHTVTLVEAQGQPARNESRIIISNVRVLAIDQTAVQSPEGSAVGKTATLELKPAETERILAAEASGLLSLTLRSVSDHAIVESDPIEEVRTVRVHRGSVTSTVTLR